MPTGDRIFASPLAKKLAAERGIDLAALNGTGPLSRIIAADVEEYVEPGMHAKCADPQDVLPSNLHALAPQPLVWLRLGLHRWPEALISRTWRPRRSARSLRRSCLNRSRRSLTTTCRSIAKWMRCSGTHIFDASCGPAAADTHSRSAVSCAALARRSTPQVATSTRFRSTTSS